MRRTTTWLTRGLPVLCVLVVATTFGPWARSGARTRSSYELLDVAGRAGVLPEQVEGLAAVWYLTPALAGVALVATSLRRTRIAAATGASLGALVGTGAVLVDRSPLTSAGALVPAAILSFVTVVSGLVLLAGFEEHRR